MRGFIGIDIETTGLEAQHDRILEIGAVLFNEKLEPVSAISLIAPDRLGLKWVQDREIDDFVLNMHEKSGLLDELDRAEWDDQENDTAMATLVETLARWHERLGGKQPMLGSSVHFDRACLEYWFPDIASTFSHRNIDASSLREYAKVVDPDKYAEVEKRLENQANHRAFDDVMASAELIKVLAAETWSAS